MNRIIKKIVSYLYFRYVSPAETIKEKIAFHEQYPEIVFWEVGHIVEISYSYVYESHNFKRYSRDVQGVIGGVVQDISEDGVIAIKAITKYCFEDKGLRSKLPCDLEGLKINYVDAPIAYLRFLSRTSPTTIEVTGTQKRSNLMEHNFVSVYNPYIQNKGKYHDLMKAIRQVMTDNEEEWENIESNTKEEASYVIK